MITERRNSQSFRSWELFVRGGIDVIAVFSGICNGEPPLFQGRCTRSSEATFYSADRLAQCSSGKVGPTKFWPASNELLGALRNLTSGRNYSFGSWEASYEIF